MPAVLLLGLWATAVGASPGDPARGALLADLAGCVACHTAEGGAPLAGGHALETEVGVFYGTNLTPDPTHGLGTWTYEDFVRAMRQGRAPDGRPYYPVFPYPAFSRLTDAALADLWAWLGTLTPVAKPDLPHDPAPGARSRSRVALWRLLYFRPESPPNDLSDPLALGEWLVEGPGHCGGCHTPRNAHGAPRHREHLAGSEAPPEPAPNLTPHADGLGAWSEDDLVTFLELGMTPDGDFVGGEMGRIVDALARMGEDARRAIARHLRSVPARPDPTR